MRPQSIGIVGGAGPLAGAFLLQRILSLSTQMFGCYRDADFPQVFLISYPFSEMLGKEVDTLTIRKELEGCLTFLRQSGAEILACACNTLHLFLTPSLEGSDLVPLPRVTREVLAPSDSPLVFCTSTSARSRLHARFFAATYPDAETQRQIDELIDQILRGASEEVSSERLQTLIQAQSEEKIVLGCTELSLLASRLNAQDKCVIDPLELQAVEVVKRAFSLTGGCNG